MGNRGARSFSSEARGGRFSFRAGRNWAATSAKIPTARCGRCKRVSICKHPFAISPTAVKCFGKSDGIPIPTGGHAILADGKGGLWLGGQTALVHWRGGVSQVYPIEGLKSNSDVGVMLWPLVRMDPSGSACSRRDPGRTRAIEGRSLQAIRRPTFDGSKVEVFAMTFDRDGNLWVASRGKGLYRILATSWITMAYRRAVQRFGEPSLRRPGGNLGPEHRMESTAFEIRASRPFHHRKAWRTRQRQGFWRAGTARSGLPTTDRSTESPTAASRPFAPAPVFPVIKSRRCSKTAPATCGWESMTRLYVLKDGRFRPIAERDHKPLGLVVGITEDIEGNVWAVCAEIAKGRAHPRFRGA